MKKSDKKIFIDNLHRAFDAAGYDVDWGFARALAQRYKVTPQAVSAWFREDGAWPKISTILQISHDTGMSVDELLTGRKPQAMPEPQIPVIAAQDLPSYDFEASYKAQHVSPELMIKPPMGTAAGMVGIRQAGNSMTGVQDASFPDGTVLVFDTAKKNPSSGDFILARLTDNSVLFRRFIKEGEVYLLPLNSLYQVFKGEFSVIGILAFSIDFQAN